MPKRLFLKVWNSKRRGFAGFIVFWAMLPLSIFIVIQYFEQQKIRVYEKATQSFMANEFQETRTKVEYLFERIHQTNQAIAHIPNIRALKGNNLAKGEKNLFESGRLGRDDVLTLVHLYSNLASFYRLSEVYVIRDGFAPKHGERPLLVFDDLLLKAIRESPFVLTEDVRQQAERSLQEKVLRREGEAEAENETEEYEEVERALSYFRENYGQIKSENTNGIPDFMSREVQIGKPSLYLGQYSDSRLDRVGYMVATPIFDFQGSFNGVVVTVIQRTLIEELLLGSGGHWGQVGSLNENGVGSLPRRPISNFAVLNRRLGSIIYDRRNPHVGEIAEQYQQTDDRQRLGVRTLLTPDNSHWQLIYYFDQTFALEPMARLETLGSLVVALVVVAIFLVAALISWGLDRYRFVSETLEQIDEQRRKNETLLRVVSHDINNPLAIIDGTLEVLMKYQDQELTDAQMKAWGRVRRATDIMMGILKNVRNLQSVQSGKMQVNMSDVPVEKLLDELQFVFAERLRAKDLTLKIESELSPGTCLRVDANIFGSQVLHNLMSNAIKFSRPGDEICVRIKRSKEWIHISIVDHGIGIPEEILLSIFDPAAQTNRKGTAGEIGTGFGMPLAKVYMDALGGKIFVESLSVHAHPNNHGTVVHLYILASPAQSEERLA